MADLTYKMTVTLTDGTEIDAGNFTAPAGPEGPAGADGAVGASALMFKTIGVGSGKPTMNNVQKISNFSRIPIVGDIFNFIYHDNGANTVYLCVGQITQVSETTCRYSAISYVAVPSVQSVNISQV